MAASRTPGSAPSPGHDTGDGDAAMAARGVTRPMAEQQHRPTQPPKQDDPPGSDPGARHHHDQAGPPHAQRLHMLRMHHRHTLWIYWTILILGVWLLLAPVTFGYLNEALWVDPSGGRGVWFSERTHTALRAWLMTWSDLISGALLLIFGWRALSPNRPISLWICCFIGIWLTFAPVLLWAPTAASYLNSTIVGALLIALTVLIPGMPNMIVYMQHGPPRPPGWSYNPSSWPQRWIMIALGFAGWVVSRYLAAFQLGYIEDVWEPFFGESTRRVLNSNMSHMWPISDAGLGALSYTFEFLMGWMGAPSRWRTMPWMVTFFGILVIPLGLTHIILVISQPLVVGHWCTLCLLAAAIMLPMIPLEFDEVIAMGQHLVQAKRRGDRGSSLWRTFWKGGSPEGCEPDERSPAMMQFPQQPGRVFVASIWGMSFPLSLVASTVLGIWLMLTPAALDVAKPASHVHHLCGSLIVVVSVICMGEVVRLGRYLNVLLGAGVAIVPWLLNGGDTLSHVNGLVVGLLVIALALPRGPKTEQYGLWDKYVR